MFSIRKNIKIFLPLALFSSTILTFYLMKKKRKPKRNPNSFKLLSKELVMDYLQTIKIELISLLHQTLNKRETVLAEHKRKDLSISNEIIRKIISPSLIDGIRKKEKEILQMKDIHLKDLEASMEFLLTSQSEIQFLNNEISENIQRALNGQNINYGPPFLLMQDCLKIQKKVFEQTLQKKRKLFCSLRTSGYGEINLEDRDICNAIKELEITKLANEIICNMQNFKIEEFLGICKTYEEENEEYKEEMERLQKTREEVEIQMSFDPDSVSDHLLSELFI